MFTILISICPESAVLVHFPRCILHFFIVPKSDAQNITAVTNSTDASVSPSMLPNMTSTKPTTLPVNTDTTKPSTIPINSHLTRFTPQLCGQERDIGIGKNTIILIDDDDDNDE